MIINRYLIFNIYHSNLSINTVKQERSNKNSYLQQLMQRNVVTFKSEDIQTKWVWFSKQSSSSFKQISIRFEKGKCITLNTKYTEFKLKQSFSQHFLSRSIFIKQYLSFISCGSYSEFCLKNTIKKNNAENSKYKGNSYAAGFLYGKQKAY